MRVLSGVLGMIGLIGLLYGLGLLTQLSRKLGAVTKMAPYYRGYYVAIILGMVALVVRLLVVSAQATSDQPDWAWMGHPLFALFGYHIPLAIAVTVSLAITWRYWAWLLRE